MIKEKIQNAINKQINAELYSAYLYLSMSAYFESINLKGFANWMRIQFQEELLHTMKFYEYIINRGGRVVFDIVKKPPKEWKSPLDVFENAYKHEVGVTGLIDNLVDLSVSESDHATTNFLQWFVNEQVEEKASTNEVVQKLNLIEDSKGGLFMLDRELGQRIFTGQIFTATAQASSPQLQGAGGA